MMVLQIISTVLSTILGLSVIMRKKRDVNDVVASIIVLMAAVLAIYFTWQ